MRGEDLSVTEAADVLGTSPQTVRTLLRTGQLRGERHPWGSRFVWRISNEGLEEFLSEYGRLEGHRRPRAKAPAGVERTQTPLPEPEPEPEPVTAPLPVAAQPVAQEPLAVEEPQTAGTAHRPFVLRPRGRATVVVLLLGVPLLLAFAAARTLPDLLWFHEVGQSDVYRRLVLAKTEFRLLVIGTVAVFVWLNLLVAARDTWLQRRCRGVLASGAVAVAVGGVFASATAGHWQTYLLWRHRQSFGVNDPVHGKDVGFFVFTLPFQLLVVGTVLWLVMVVAVGVVLVHAARGRVGLRPLRAAYDVQVHLALLAALFLLVVAWRLHLEEYRLELQQPGGSRTFAGAGYVDVHVRTPGLAALAALAVVLAVLCVAAPLVVRVAGERRSRRLLAVPATLVLLALVGAGLLPALVQRFTVDPNPLLSETPYLERSISATRDALGLDRVDVVPYTTQGDVVPADFPAVTQRLDRVNTWDTGLLGDRMRQLVTDTPFYRPDEPALDVVPVDGKPQPTVVSARELDLGPDEESTQTWSNNRLAYTHGLGLVRFSGTDVGADRGPRLLDTGLGLRQPRIYFGSFPSTGLAVGEDPALAFTSARGLADSSWVLVDTKRPEVDIASPLASPRPAYHYRGPAGIPLSSWERRALFAVALGSKQVLLSDDVTSGTRLLLHRDLGDRLRTLAPFVSWEDHVVPLTAHGHVVFVVDGYTTSRSYPYAEQVDLGGTPVAYARASFRATVDAYSGRTTVYLTDPEDPIARAWADAFPTLVRPDREMPSQLRSRLRYPADLFDAQATAYQRFHARQPDVFASGADQWARPLALSGPLEVAGDVDFDESDEDDLRLTLQPSYSYGVPPGHEKPTLLRNTYYSPNRGQNLVGTLTGWVDGRGRARLVSQSLPRNPVTLGPAQVSRLVFATPRVRNLLGLRNLEVRDLDTASLDSVILGRPHLLFLRGGLMQVQSLYEGSRGPGAARLLGVTVYVNGRAGLGPDVTSAARQALNAPPHVEIRRPAGPAVVGSRVQIKFRVSDARRELVTITTGKDRKRTRFTLSTGQGLVSVVPHAPGQVRVRVDVLGLDGTRITARSGFIVLSRPPAIKFLRTPHRAVVGEPVRIPFRVQRGRHAVVEVSTRAGIVFTRRYVLRDHRGVVDWTPETSGLAVVRLRAQGRQGQTVTASLRLRVHQHAVTTSPTVSVLTVPEELSVGVPATFTLTADGCRVAVVRIRGPGDDVPVFRFPCPLPLGTFTWTPQEPGDHLLTAQARGRHGLRAVQRVRLTVAPAPSTGPSTSPSTSSPASPSSGPRRRGVR